MGEIVGYRVRDGVALITVDNPPVNALSQRVRAGLLAAVQQAIAAPEVGALVIRAEGRTFPAGADLRDYTARSEAPTLGEVCRAIEDSPKPVIAAIHGTALGGGLELALACHYRLAMSDAQLGLPDVALGASPSAGATQRLPRLVGPGPALDILLSARPISAEGAARIGLIDKVILKNLDRAAFGSGRNMVIGGAGPRPSRTRREGLQDPKAYLEVVEARRKAVAGDLREAAHRVVDLVESALLLPFETGLEMEHAVFEELVESDQARGLRHAFLAERRAARATGPARPIARVGVVGDGAFSAEVVLAVLAAKLPVIFFDVDPDRLADVRDAVEAELSEAVARGRMSAARRDRALARLTSASEVDALSDCDLVIEALDGSGPEARRDVFAKLNEITRPGTLLASATVADAARLVELAQASARSADVIGLRFSPPAHLGRLVEILRHPAGADDLAATAVAFARAMGKTPVLPMRPGPGLAAPMLGALWAAALWLVEEGAAPEEIDAAVRAYGFAEGPLELLDRIGVSHGVLPDGAARDLVAQVRAAGGFRSAGPGGDPDVAEVIDRHRRELGIAPRRLDVEEIQGRCLGALVNRGATLVANKTAARPSDIDAAMVAGYGFPRWRGGPMEAADLGGLLDMRNRLRDWAQGRDGALWRPHPLFDELIKNGRRFDDLNA